MPKAAGRRVAPVALALLVIVMLAETVIATAVVSVRSNSAVQRVAEVKKRTTAAVCSAVATVVVAKSMHFGSVQMDYLAAALWAAETERVTTTG